MWNVLGTIITSLLPFLVKAVWAIIEKKEDSEQLKQDMIRLIDSLNKDVPIQLHDKYNEQVERIREQLRKEGANV
jgi:phosphopantothenate synthetase